MKKGIVKKLLLTVFAAMFVCIPMITANATQIDETTEADNLSPLAFEIANFTYELEDDTTQGDLPKGFTLGDWEYNGVAVKAGFTENSDMVCIMGEDVETGSKYRFIYDPEHDLFVPYFGADIKNGYIYTVPLYDDAEVPYGFVESYFVLQTVPMFTYMRADAELTQEEIAVGSLSEDNYLVFLMMDENGNEVHYTYDLIDRTFQRALLQKKDAEKVTELNEVIDGLHAEIGKLNAEHARRMNLRLTLIGGLLVVILVLVAVVINLFYKIGSMVNGDDDDEEESFDLPNAEEDIEDLPEAGNCDEAGNAENDGDIRRSLVEKNVTNTKKPVFYEDDEDDDLEILDLDLED